MSKLLTMLLFYLFVSTSLAQMGSGNEGPVQPGPSSPALPVTPRIGVLAYNEDLDSQAVWFQATAAEPPKVTGETIDHWIWGPEPNSLWGPVTVPASEQDKQTVKVYVTGPGFYALHCTIQIRNVSTNAIRTVHYTSYCAAIGGPLTLDVLPKKLPGENEFFEVFVNDHDDPSQPFYLQYFGYNHLKSTPPGVQPAQDGKATALQQPDGTTYAWSVPTPLFSPELFNAQQQQTAQPHAITVKAEGHGIGKTVSCEFTLVWDEHPNDPNNTALQQTATDNTAQTPHLTEPGAMMVNKFSGHEPRWLNTYITRKSKNDPGSFPTSTQHPDPVAPVPTGGTSCGIQTWMVLKDAGGDPMPGVWVQERFPAGTPDNFVTNDVTGKLWTTMLENHVGVFNGEDHLGYYWEPPKPDPNWPKIGEGEPYPLFYHVYWAGTSEPYGGNTGGFQVPKDKVYKIVFTPGDINNVPSPGKVGHWAVDDPSKVSPE